MQMAHFTIIGAMIKLNFGALFLVLGLKPNTHTHGHPVKQLYFCFEGNFFHFLYVVAKRERGR